MELGGTVAPAKLESGLRVAIAGGTDEQLSVKDRNPLVSRLQAYMLEELDTDTSRIPLSIACFLSGFIGCVSFSACSIWVGYQTGNTVQVFIAVGRAMYDPLAHLDSFSISDWQALCSVFSFSLACQFGGRLLPWRKKSRARIILSTILQMLLTGAAAVTAHHTDGTAFNLSRENPSWHNAFGYATLSLLSMSMGMQGVVGESMGTGLTATVVLTSIFCQLGVLPSPLKHSKPRDDRLMAILLFGLGGFVAHFPLSRIQSAGTLVIAAGMRFLLVPLWLLVRSSEGDSFARRRDVEGKDHDSPVDLAIRQVDTNATLVDVQASGRKGYRRAQQSQFRYDRPQTAPS